MPQIPVISIIDDDASVRVATHNLIRSLGYTVHTFASADEFLRSPELNDTSCVIADVQMPAMSGIDLAARLRNRDSDIPIILITGYPDENILEKAAAAGIYHVLLKPHLEESLLSHIRGAIQESHPASR